MQDVTLYRLNATDELPDTDPQRWPRQEFLIAMRTGEVLTDWDMNHLSAGESLDQYRKRKAQLHATGD